MGNLVVLHSHTMHTPRSFVQRERDRFEEERKVADEVCVEVERGVRSGEVEKTGEEEAASAREKQTTRSISVV